MHTHFSCQRFTSYIVAWHLQSLLDKKTKQEVYYIIYTTSHTVSGLNICEGCYKFCTETLNFPSNNTSMSDKSEALGLLVNFKMKLEPGVFNGTVCFKEEKRPIKVWKSDTGCIRLKMVNRTNLNWKPLTLDKSSCRKKTFCNQMRAAGVAEIRPQTPEELIKSPKL